MRPFWKVLEPHYLEHGAELPGGWTAIGEARATLVLLDRIRTLAGPPLIATATSGELAVIGAYRAFILEGHAIVDRESAAVMHGWLVTTLTSSQGLRAHRPPMATACLRVLGELVLALRGTVDGLLHGTPVRVGPAWDHAAPLIATALSSGLEAIAMHETTRASMRDVLTSAAQAAEGS